MPCLEALAGQHQLQGLIFWSFLFIRGLLLILSITEQYSVVCLTKHMKGRDCFNLLFELGGPRLVAETLESCWMYGQFHLGLLPAHDLITHSTDLLQSWVESQFAHVRHTTSQDTLQSFWAGIYHTAIPLTVNKAKLHLSWKKQRRGVCPLVCSGRLWKAPRHVPF